MIPLKTLNYPVALLILALMPWGAQAAEESAKEAAKDPAKAVIPVKRPEGGVTVDFDKQVLPILKANCLACHNRTSSKGDLLLETPADILKGGESGPAAVAGKAAESLLFKLSTHESKPRMPPRENKVNARDLTPEELGIVAAWIDQGAKASERRLEKIEWQSLASSFTPIYAAAVSADGVFAACGRANQIDVYHLPTGEWLGRLADPSLGEISHRDVVNSLALNADGTQIASGGYREVKLWRRPATAVYGTNGVVTSGTNWLQSDASKRFLTLTNGVAQLWKVGENKKVADLKGSRAAALRSAQAARLAAFHKSTVEFRQASLDALVKEQTATQERLKKAIEGDAAALKALTEKETAAAKPRRAKFDAEMDVARAERDPAAKGAAEILKKAKEKLDAATKAVEGPENEVRTARLKAATARNELELSRQAIHRGETQIMALKTGLMEAKQELATAEAEVEAAKKFTTECERPIRAMALSPSGLLAATVDEKSLIQVWETGSGMAVASLAAPGPAVDGIAFAGDRHVVFRGGAEQRAWHLQPAWKLEHTIGTGGGDSPIADRVNALAFRADGRRLAGGSGEPSRGSEIRIWDPATGAQLYAITNLHSDAVLSLAFSPDGNYLASGGADRFARVLDAGLAKPVRAFEGHTAHVLGVAWAPNGRTLATAGADNIVKFWNFTTGERRKQGGGFTKEVGAVGYVANDQVLGVGGDSVVRVLNENGDKVRDLEGAKDFQTIAAVTPDGSVMISGGVDGVLRVWRGTENKLAQEFGAPKATPAK